MGAFDHGGIGDVLCRFDRSLNGPVVLLWEKPFWNDNIEVDGGDHGREHQSDDEQSMLQRPAQADGIETERALEPALKECHHPPVLRSFLPRPQQPCAHHGRERQCDDARHQNCHTHSDGELAEQASNQAAHQQQRDEDGDQ